MVAGCRGTNAAGSPCSAQPVGSDGFCAWHSPARAAERDEWRRRGGKGRSSKVRARKALPDNVLTTGEVRGLIGLTIRGVLAGRVEPGVGNSVANLARVALTAAEQDDLEARLRELEQAAGIGRRTG